MRVVGVDLHRRRSRVAVLDDGGRESMRRNGANGSSAMREPFVSFPAGTPVAVEATYGWS